MIASQRRRGRKRTLNGKWLVLIILGGAMILAVIASRYSKLPFLEDDSATQPTGAR